MKSASPRPLVPVRPRPSFELSTHRPWRRHRPDRSVLPLVLELLARELRSGSTVAVALRSVAQSEPAASSLVPVVERIENGALVGDELDRWAAALDSRDADLARAVLRLGLRTGAALADSLDRVAATVRDRIDLDGELQALTAQSRASATVLAVAPAAFLLVIGLADPAMVSPLLTTSLGLICLTIGISLDALGFWWMRRLVAGIDR